MTIAEIAQRAGVSKTAVSRYLNNGYVSSEKREAIRRVIEETGYVPSPQAQMLRTGRSRTVGVIVPRIDSESISRVVAGISLVLEEHGYHLLLANTANKAEKELEYLEVFRTGNVDGVILLATVLTAAHKKAMRECGVPVVLLGQKLDGAGCVFHDDQGAARSMTEFLIAAGRRRIAYIGVTSRDKAAGAARRAGYLEALSGAGIEAMPALYEQSDFSAEGGYAAMGRLLAKHEEIDAVFCATDSIAAGAMRQLGEQGRVIPEQIAVAGIGHSRLSELVTPRLTTVHFYYQLSGEEGAQMLLNLLENEKACLKQIQLGFEIVKQETV